MKPMARSALPPGYGVVELANGRFYPVRVDLHEQALASVFPLTTCFELIPLAIGPHLHLPQVERGFLCSQDAVSYCLRRSEEWALLYTCQQQAAFTELYPERNIWYREEIERLTRSRARFSCSQPSIRIAQYGSTVWAHIWLPFDRDSCITVEAATIDEAFEGLYVQVSTQLAVDTGCREWFPERNAWYAEAIRARTGNPPFIDTSILPVACSVYLPDDSLCLSKGQTVDEALEALCEQVYTAMATLESQQEASTPLDIVSGVREARG